MYFATSGGAVQPAPASVRWSPPPQTLQDEKPAALCERRVGPIAIKGVERHQPFLQRARLAPWSRNCSSPIIYNIINNMKTIAVTIDDETLRLLDELTARGPSHRARSALVRAALRDFAERERRRVTEEREREIFRKNRKQLAREARLLTKEQARP